jgi:hypothetical protein
MDEAGKKPTVRAGSGRPGPVPQKSGNRAVSLLLRLTLSIAMWDYCLPVGANMSAWLQPIQVVRGVHLHEALFVVACLLLPGRITIMADRRCKPAFGVAAIMVALAAWCAIAGAFGPRPLMDFAESMRLTLSAAWLVVVAGYAIHDCSAFLRAALLGAAMGTAVNLVTSFSDPSVTIGSLPLLHGQNGPGTAMGITVCLSTWLMLVGRTWLDAIAAISAAALGLMGASISYSKVGMGSALAGAVAMATVLVVWPGKAAHRARQLVVPGIIALVLVGYARFDDFRDLARSLQVVIYNKWASLPFDAVGDFAGSDASTVARLAYVEGTVEIMNSNPIGVGYSGFYAAMQGTSVYSTSRRADEDAEAGAAGDSNPHATPLYYGSAGGWLALAASLAAIVLMVTQVCRATRAGGLAAWTTAFALSFAIAGAYFTTPTGLLTRLLIAPLALAGGLAVSLCGRRVPPRKALSQRVRSDARSG